MEYRQLVSFITVVQEHGFQRAADRLGYAQSSITAHIRRLEDELRVTLFDRLGKTVLLTTSGHRFYPYALDLVRRHRQAYEMVQDNQTPAGPLTIGVTDTMMSYWLPTSLRVFLSDYPEIFPTVTGVDYLRIPEQLQQGMYDLALLIESPDWHPPELTVRALADEPLQLVQASSTTKEHSSLSDLMLMTSHACSWRPVFEHLLRHQAYEHTTTVELPSAEAIKQCLLAGLGASLLPRLVVKDELHTGELQSFPLTPALAPLQVSICWHKDKHLTPAMQAFIHSMQASI